MTAKISDRVTALETIVPEIRDDIKDLRGDIKTILDNQSTLKDSILTVTTERNYASKFMLGVASFFGACFAMTIQALINRFTGNG